MGPAFINRFFKKHGKKALVIYVCWSVIKGIVLLIFVFKIFG